MKKTLRMALAGLALIGLLASAPVASAQPAGGYEVMAQRQRLADELGLTPQQRQQMREVIRQLREETRGMSREQRRAIARERLRAILTPEQLAKLDRIRAERRGGDFEDEE